MPITFRSSVRSDTFFVLFFLKGLPRLLVYQSLVLSMVSRQLMTISMTFCHSLVPIALSSS